MTDIQSRLDAHIPEAAISQKQGLDYVSHRYIKNHLNEVFGWDGWHYKVLRVDLDRENMGCFVHLRLTIIGPERHLVERDGLAFGFAAGQSTNQAFDFAIAEAVTDALKRAAVSLGNSMGLELYPMTKGAKRQQQPRQQAPRGTPNVAGEVDTIKRFVSSIGGATNLAGLKIVGKSIGEAHLSPDGRESLKPIYSTKLHELEMEVMDTNE